MITIWKYPLRLIEKQDVWMPEGAQVLSAQMQAAEEGIVLWALVNPEAPRQRREIAVYGTGGNYITDSPGRYISTTQMGEFVWHIFELE